jgi:hypothetical protein
MEHYPPHIKTKAEAMWFGVRQVLNGRTANGSRARRSAVHMAIHCGRPDVGRQHRVLLRAASDVAL